MNNSEMEALIMQLIMNSGNAKSLAWRLSSLHAAIS